MLKGIMNQQLAKVGAKARALVLGQSLSVGDAVAKAIDELANSSEVFAEPRLKSDAVAALSGLGPLEPFMQDPQVEEIWMNKPNQLFVHRQGKTESHDLDFSALEQRVVIDRMLRSVGRRLDRTSPFVDAPLADGSRLHVVIPDITRAELSFNIRRYIQNRATLEALRKSGTLTAEQLALLKNALMERQTIVVSGATAAGKTTMLSALLRELPTGERIVSVEDTFELALSNPDWVAMQTRPPSLEGAGEIDLRRLIRESLRMRPGWLVVGEVRGAEAIELLVALNSGIPALCTVHANSAEDAFTKLQTLPLLAGVNIPVEFLAQVTASTVGLFIHCAIGVDGIRRVDHMARALFESGKARFEKVA